MTLETWARLLLVFAHLLLCVQVLYVVLSADLRVLRRRVSARGMERVHRRVTWLLAGLWATGLAVVWLDFAGQWQLLLERPKLLAKLTCVVALTANAWLLHRWALPRLVSDAPLPLRQARLLAAAGGVSTTSWLMAAFIGVARPMASWSLVQAVGFYAVVVLGGVLLALLVCPSRLLQRQRHMGQTALEEAAETLVTESPLKA